MILSYLKLLRPHQWIKNLLLLFPPFFAGKLFEVPSRSLVLPSLLAFSFASSCSYIINDIMDRESDRNHAVKKNRSIAKGEIPISIAVVFAFLLYAVSMLMAASVSRHFEGYVIVYLLISLTYTFFFRNTLLVDIFFIASGFVIRVLAGGEAFRIPVTSWLFLTVFLVSLLLAAGKRLGEVILLGDEAHKHRKIYEYYSQTFLEGILWFSASSALVTYALYSLEHKNSLYYTVPLAAFGLLRYIYLAKQGAGDPTVNLLTDKQIMSVGLIWTGMIGLILYT